MPWVSDGMIDRLAQTRDKLQKHKPVHANGCTVCLTAEHKEEMQKNKKDKRAWLYWSMQSSEKQLLQRANESFSTLRRKDAGLRPFYYKRKHEVTRSCVHRQYTHTCRYFKKHPGGASNTATCSGLDRGTAVYQSSP